MTRGRFGGGGGGGMCPFCPPPPPTPTPLGSGTDIMICYVVTEFSFRFFKKGSCQLLAKVCARSTG